MPRVSIALPAYNSERYIAQSIESLLAQTLGDFELIISDNASTDGTADICRRYAALDSRVRYVRRQENIGGPANFCYVWSLCSGEYHKWSTADDYWAPEFLAKSVEVLDTHPDVVLCHPQARLIDSDSVPIRDYEDKLHLVAPSPRQRFNDLLRLIGLCNAHLGLIRRSAMTRTGLIGSERNSDTHFLAELTLYGKFWLLPEVLFFRRFHQQSSSWDRSDADRQRAYYDPGRMQPAGMHTLRKFRRLFGAVMRAPVGGMERIGLVADLCRYARWERRELAQEIYSRVAGRGKA